MLLQLNSLILLIILSIITITYQYKYKLTHIISISKLNAKKDWSPPKSNDLPIEDSNRGLAFTVELPRVAGLSWGSDLSFRWIFVQDIDPSGLAAQTGLINKGDYIIGIGNTSTIAKDFNFVLDTLSKQEGIFNYTFFRGTKEQLLGRPVVDPTKEIYTITVIQEGKPNIQLTCPGGSNLRTVLVSNGINVYRSLTRWTNCNGKQRCGTCIVDIKEGNDLCSLRALDEELVLRENPESYRLSCVTYVYGDVTVEVQSPVGAAQWTR